MVWKGVFGKLGFQRLREMTHCFGCLCCFKFDKRIKTIFLDKGPGVIFLMVQWGLTSVFENSKTSNKHLFPLWKQSEFHNKQKKLNTLLKILKQCLWITEVYLKWQGKATTGKGIFSSIMFWPKKNLNSVWFLSYFGSKHLFVYFSRVLIWRSQVFLMYFLKVRKPWFCDSVFLSWSRPKHNHI